MALPQVPSLEHEPIEMVPDSMANWNLDMVLPSNYWDPPFGVWKIINVEPSPVELQHQVYLVDQNYKAVAGVWVIAGYPGGTGPNLSRLKPAYNPGWPGAPAVLVGVAGKTNGGGEVNFTVGPTGGEDIWVWDVRPDPARRNRLSLYYSSTTLKNCVWIPTGLNNHTCVRVEFQLCIPDFVTEEMRLEALETRVAALEAQLGNNSNSNS